MTLEPEKKKNPWAKREGKPIRGKVEVVIDKSMNRGKRWTMKNILHMPVKITYLDRHGKKRGFSQTGSTKTHLIADKRATILKVEVPLGGRTKITKVLAQYGWSVK